MYVTPNYKSKAALRKGIAAGDAVTVFAPGLGTPQTDGVETVEGPHYPEPHRWYARVKVEDGRVVKVLS